MTPEQRYQDLVDEFAGIDGVLLPQGTGSAERFDANRGASPAEPSCPAPSKLGGVMELQVTDSPDQERFEIRTDGELAGFLQYHIRGGNIALIHTETDPRFRGHGIAGQLIQASLDSARERHLGVLPYCPFAQQWITEHPEYADLMPPDKRGRFGF